MIKVIGKDLEIDEVAKVLKDNPSYELIDSSSLDLLVPLLEANDINTGFVLVSQDLDSIGATVTVYDCDNQDIIELSSLTDQLVLIVADIPVSLPKCQCGGKDGYEMQIQTLGDSVCGIVAVCQTCLQQYGLEYKLTRVIKLKDS